MYGCIRLEVKEPGMQQRARHCNCLSRSHGSDRKCEYTLLIVIFQKQEMSCQFYRHHQMKLMLNDVPETHKTPAEKSRTVGSLQVNESTHVSIQKARKWHSVASVRFRFLFMYYKSIKKYKSSITPWYLSVFFNPPQQE